MRLIVIALGLCAAYPFPDPEPKDPYTTKLREVDVKGLSITPKEVATPKPAKITSAKELEEVIEDKEARGKVAKQVNFAKEYLVLFRWAGSGGDRLSFEVAKGKSGEEAVFKLKQGLTRDYRHHVKLFAVPKALGHKFGS